MVYNRRVDDPPFRGYATTTVITEAAKRLIAVGEVEIGLELAQRGKRLERMLAHFKDADVPPSVFQSLEATE